MDSKRDKKQAELSMGVKHVRWTSTSVDEDSGPRQDGRRVFLFLLAAIPAGFLPIGYLVVCGRVLADIVLGFDRPLPPQDGSFTWWIGTLSIYGTLIQFPVYAAWAVLSRRVGYRAKLAWCVILLMLNMFAIPWFLYCKYQRQLWPPAGMHMKGGPTRRRWHQFSLRACLIAIVLLAVCLVPIAALVQSLQSSCTVSVTVRVTSSGTVEWRGDAVPISSLRQRLEQALHVTTSQGVKPNLIIECYSDVRASDILRLKAIGHDAGFGQVKVEQLRWSSPEWSKSTD